MTLAGSGVAIAVKTGAPKPDISTPEALTQTLLKAKSIAYSEPSAGGASGVYFAKLLERLGIAEQMKPKTKYPPAGGFSAELLFDRRCRACGSTEAGIAAREWRRNCRFPTRRSEPRYRIHRRNHDRKQECRNRQSADRQFALARSGRGAPLQGSRPASNRCGSMSLPTAKITANHSLFLSINCLISSNMRSGSRMSRTYTPLAETLPKPKATNGLAVLLDPVASAESVNALKDAFTERDFLNVTILDHLFID